MIVWLTGLCSSGKSTLGETLQKRLGSMGYRAEVLDGDEIRQRLCNELGYSRGDRDENVRRIGYVAGLLAKHGVIAVVSAIAPYREARDAVRKRNADFVEVYVNAPIEVCEARDVKGLYRKARSGQLAGLTGIDQPYEAPLHPEVECRTDRETVEESVTKILSHIVPRLEQHPFGAWAWAPRNGPKLPEAPAG
jgi:adenylyl-sulfate kinase